jgi:hypothetical protein
MKSAYKLKYFSDLIEHACTSQIIEHESVRKQHANESAVHAYRVQRRQTQASGKECSVYALYAYNRQAETAAARAISMDMTYGIQFSSGCKCNTRVCETRRQS